MNYKVLNVNGYLFNIVAAEYCFFLSVKAVPENEYAADYAKRWLNSVSSSAESCIYGSSGLTYYDEFKNNDLYRTGLAFIKTVGTLDNKAKLIGLWPTHIYDDGLVTFTFDHLVEGVDK